MKHRRALPASRARLRHGPDSLERLDRRLVAQLRRDPVRDARVGRDLRAARLVLFGSAPD